MCVCVCRPGTIILRSLNLKEHLALSDISGSLLQKYRFTNVACIFVRFIMGSASGCVESFFPPWGKYGQLFIFGPFNTIRHILSTLLILVLDSVPVSFTNLRHTYYKQGVLRSKAMSIFSSWCVLQPRRWSGD